MARKPARRRETTHCKLASAVMGRGYRQIVCRIEPLEDRRMLASTPFYGTPFQIPTTIQAEDFDNGGQGVAYYDETAPNQGGQYRLTERVDIEKTSDVGGGYDMNYILPGEWENYTINVPATGAYNFGFRLASIGGGSFHLNLDGQNFTGAIGIPPTGGPQSWTTITKSNVNLPAGQHVLTVAWDSSGTASPYPANFNWMQITAVPPPLPTVNIAATDPNAAEQNSDPGVFTVSRTGSTTSALTVPITLGGSATNGYDYNTLASSVTIPVGQTSAQITVTPIDQHIVGGSKTVIATLGSSTTYSAGTSTSATVTIADNDSMPPPTLPVVSIVATDANAAEQNSDPGVFTVSRTGATTSALTVPIVLSGSATNGSDYNTLASSVTIPAGQSSAQIVVTPIDDHLVEGNETVVAAIGSSSAYTTGSPADATVTIADNDTVTPPPGSPKPYSGTPAAVPGLIEAENFDLGGEGVAYHDTDASNDGGAYRTSEGVDIQVTSDTGGGYNVGWTSAGEWMGYTVNVANSGSYNLDVRAANFGGGGAFHVEVDGVNVTGTLAVPDTGGFNNYTDILKNGISLTAGTHFVKLVMDGNSRYGFSGNFNWMKFSTVAVPPPPPPTSPTPFGGTPWSIAGQIEAENFDVGGEGIAYHDTTAANQGGAYRTNEAVDIEPASDTGGGYDVGYTHAGEWLGYTVNVTSSGNYDFDARVADVGAGAAFHVEVDGVNVTGSLAIPDTTSFTKYVDVTKAAIPLTAGQHFLKVVFDANAPSGYAGNLNWFKFTASPVSPPPAQSTPFSGTPAAVPGAIEAENFDAGGEGVAYHDTEAANFGKAYRPNEGVDIETTADRGGGYDIGWVKAGEWLNYTINVPVAGKYTLTSRVANLGAGGMFHVTFGNTATGEIAVPDTGGFQNFTDVTTSGIQLAAGTYIMKVSMDATSSIGFVGNFNRFTLTSVPTGTGSQPDFQIRNYGDTAYTGTGVINTTGLNQIIGQDQPFFPSIFQVRVTNTGAAPDSFIITGPASTSANWRIWYYDSQVQGGHVGGGQYTTDQVTAGGWNTGVIQPGQFKDFRFEVGASPLAPADDTYTVQLKATSASDPSKSDVVVGKAFNDPRWEFEIRRRNYAQTTGESGTYLLDLQNYGNIADQYIVHASGDGTGYTVKYFDAYNGGNDVTQQVTSTAGWKTNVIGFHALQSMAVQITSTDGQAHSVQFTVSSLGNGSQRTITISNVAPAAATPSFFPIGVWDQPAGNFDTWKNRGINTVVQYDSYGGTQSMAYWSQIALDKGLEMIRQPDSNPAADAAQWSNLLAWMQPDEPELNGFTPAQAQSLYNSLKQAAPNIPIYENFDASDWVGWQQDVSQATYAQYLPATDWVSGGMYPISGWNRPDDLDVMGRAVDRMEALAQGAPTFAVIESSNQMGPWLPANTPGPNAAQVRAQVWDSIVHGARGIIYFPQQLSETAGFSYDNTPPDVAAEMTKINAQITSIGAALESPLDPPTLGVTANAPLEATWRSYNGHLYYIVFNYSNQTTTQQITLNGAGSATSATVQGESRDVSLVNGSFSDTFTPYQAHIYVI